MPDVEPRNQSKNIAAARFLAPKSSKIRTNIGRNRTCFVFSLKFFSIKNIAPARCIAEWKPTLIIFLYRDSGYRTSVLERPFVSLPDSVSSRWQARRTAFWRWAGDIELHMAFIKWPSPLDKSPRGPRAASSRALSDQTPRCGVHSQDFGMQFVNVRKSCIYIQFWTVATLTTFQADIFKNVMPTQQKVCLHIVAHLFSTQVLFGYTVGASRILKQSQPPILHLLNLQD